MENGKVKCVGNENNGPGVVNWSGVRVRLCNCLGIGVRGLGVE